MSTIFTRIVQGEIPCYKIAETTHYLAFLDINPLKMGHTLVIPKREVDFIFNLEDEELAGLILFSKIVAKAIEQAVPCKRIGVAVIGLEVPHTHIHLVPLKLVGDLNFAQTKLSPSRDELEHMAEKIRNHIPE